MYVCTKHQDCQKNSLLLRITKNNEKFKLTVYHTIEITSDMFTNN